MDHNTVFKGDAKEGWREITIKSHLTARINSTVARENPVQDNSHEHPSSKSTGLQG